jgi:hypothetical protein
MIMLNFLLSLTGRRMKLELGSCTSEYLVSDMLNPASVV